MLEAWYFIVCFYIWWRLLSHVIIFLKLFFFWTLKIFTSISLKQFLFLVTLWWSHLLNSELKYHWAWLSFFLPFLLFQVTLLFILISLGYIILFPSFINEAEQNDQSFYNSTSTLHFSHLLIFFTKAVLSNPNFRGPCVHVLSFSFTT